MFWFFEFIDVENYKLVVVKVCFLLINTHEEVELVTGIWQVSGNHYVYVPVETLGLSLHYVTHILLCIDWILRKLEVFNIREFNVFDGVVAFQ